MRGEELAGPMVQTIFEWRKAIAVCESCSLRETRKLFIRSHLVNPSQGVGAFLPRGTKGAPTFKDTQNRALAPEEILLSVSATYETAVIS
jgi:hypothetical protein